MTPPQVQPMKAQMLYDGSLAVAGRCSTLVVSRIWAGVGWPDTEQGALCVLGESLNGRYHALGEWRGGLYELAAAALTVRADLLVDSFWIDASDEVSTAYFRRLDFPAGKMQAAPRTRRSTFRATRQAGLVNEANRPAIVGVRPLFRENFRASLETLRGVAAAGRLVVHQDRCPSLAFALKRDLDYLLRSPVVKALVWALTAMESTQDQIQVQVEPDDGWYHSFHRT